MRIAHALVLIEHLGGEQKGVGDMVLVQFFQFIELRGRDHDELLARDARLYASGATQVARCGPMWTMDFKAVRLAPVQPENIDRRERIDA
jgi:hypothetical protein